MKIAIPYDNGNVFGHFGKTEQFRVYEAENGKILSASVLGTDGTGHEALAELLKKWGVQVLICGGIGGGALNALDAAGIQVISGAEGNADEAAEKWLRGELESTGSVCDHHHEEERSCGGGCGHCPGHCERSAIQGKMWEKPAGCITGAPSMTEPSLIPPLTGASPFSLSAVRGR